MNALHSVRVTPTLAKLRVPEMTLRKSARQLMQRVGAHARFAEDRSWRCSFVLLEETIMAQNYRNQSGGNPPGRSDYGRGGRDQSGADRDRYRTGGEFDEASRWSEGAGRRDLDGFYERDPYGRDQGTTTSSWHEDQGDRGGYFGTGSYIDDGGASRGFGSDFERARAQMQQRSGGAQSRGTSGDVSNYGRSYYGSQSGYGRDDYQRAEQPWRSQQRGNPSGNPSTNYGERSGWDYDQSRGGQRAGSGSTRGAYGYDSGARSDYGSFAGAQSHRGRGPQGYQRSDERLKEMICERLTDDPAIDATNVTVEVTSQVVKLTGTVDDRSTKYEIEELVESFGGVKDIDNQLRAQSRQSNWNPSGANQASTSGQQPRGGSDWDAGSSSLSSSGTTTGRSTSSGSSATTGPSATSGNSPNKRN
jgi:osmotically-inducible protein OsmY